MKSAADADSWRKKYFDSLASLESEQRRFHAIETALKRVMGRLCSASLGQSNKLDEQIKRLQVLIRGETGIDDLEQITPALTDAIQALDHAVPATQAIEPLVPAAPARLARVPSPTSVHVPAAAPDPGSLPASSSALDGDQLRAIVAHLLAQISTDAALSERAQALEASIAAPAAADMQAVLGDVAQLVGQRIQRIERAKQEVELLLAHMVGKLEEIGQVVAAQSQSHIQSHASSETLNVQLAGEMKAMGESVDAAGDLEQIRQQVRRRIESIDQHLQAFRARETALAAQMRDRSAQLSARIEELEGEAQRLQSELHVEQRLATLDALTRIPNRLAYEKRMREELERWQRFKQPVCIAVWDVDHFKRINDTYGHRAGDRVLGTVAQLLAGRIRSSDFIARYGGEEFVMILPGTKLADAARVIEQLRRAVGEIGFHFRGAPVAVTMSCGVTSLSTEDSAGTAFDRADQALYRAKQSGRDRCVVIDAANGGEPREARA